MPTTIGTTRALWIAAALFAMALGAGVWFEASRGRRAEFIGGPFRLQSQTGETIDSEQLKGKPYAIFFGFTHCPEVCPTTIVDMQRLFDQVGPAAKDFRVYFVSVDPERDTPAVLKDYLASFAPHIVGLTGAPEQIAAVAQAFRVYYRKIPTRDGDYTMDHSAIVYLMDANGRFVNMIAYQEPEASALSKLRALLGG
jgi:protein SCO1